MVKNPPPSLWIEQQGQMQAAIAVISPPLWHHLNPQNQKQLVQLLAELIRRRQLAPADLKDNQYER